MDPRYEWIIYFQVMPAGSEVGDEREVIVAAEDANAPDALIAAVQTVRQTMGDGDGFHAIHVGASRAVEPRHAGSMARITTEDEIAEAISSRVRV